MRMHSLFPLPYPRNLPGELLTTLVARSVSDEAANQRRARLAHCVKECTHLTSSITGVIVVWPWLNCPCGYPLGYPIRCPLGYPLGYPLGCPSDQVLGFRIAMITRTNSMNIMEFWLEAISHGLCAGLFEGSNNVTGFWRNQWRAGSAHRRLLLISDFKQWIRQ